jgi:hypothetical protein
MKFTEALLLAALVAIGAVAFLDERTATRHRLRQMLLRERRLEQEIYRLRQRRRTLKIQARALSDDPYYVERLVREQLGWTPVNTPSVLLPEIPEPAEDTALAAAPTPSDRAEPAAPAARDSLPADRAAASPRAAPAGESADALLAALGYRSTKHFQRKMVGGRLTGEPDSRTTARARGLLTMLHRAGFSSVESFQRQHDLDADGILGRKTEERLRKVLASRSESWWSRQREMVVLGDDGEDGAVDSSGRPGG